MNTFEYDEKIYKGWREQTYYACKRFIREHIFYPVWYRIFGQKFHIIKTSLPPCPWIDSDQRMLYAIMAIVEWFVENDMYPTWTREDYDAQVKSLKESLSEIDDPKDSYGQLESLNNQFENDQNILKIYKWWKEYPSRVEEIENCDHGDKWDTYMALSDKLEKEEQEMAELAVKMRGAMWS